MLSSTTCNSNCICVDADCKYSHRLSYKDRKIVNKLYSTIPNINKEEPSSSSRKKNCAFGQLCINENCGFRHRLCFKNREKLSILYNYNKICPNVKDETVEQLPTKTAQKDEIATKNSFITLEDIPEEIVIEVKEIKEVVNDVKPCFPPVYSGISWALLLKEPKEPNGSKVEKKLNLNVETSNWEELADDDFYMKF